MARAPCLGFVDFAGVADCPALPGLAALPWVAFPDLPASVARLLLVFVMPGWYRASVKAPWPACPPPGQQKTRRWAGSCESGAGAARSEERRVGKEGRWRGRREREQMRWQ